MALTLCLNCRLPINVTADECHLCTAPVGSRPVAVARGVPVAAAVALVATLVFARRR